MPMLLFLIINLHILRLVCKKFAHVVSYSPDVKKEYMINFSKL